MHKLVERSRWFYKQLKKMNIESIYFEGSNIVTINKKYMKKSIAKKYGLVSDDDKNPEWYKVVMMVHVKRAKLIMLLNDLK